VRFALALLLGIVFGTLSARAGVLDCDDSSKRAGFEGGAEKRTEWLADDSRTLDDLHYVLEAGVSQACGANASAYFQALAQQHASVWRGWEDTPGLAADSAGTEFSRDFLANLRFAPTLSRTTGLAIGALAHATLVSAQTYFTKFGSALLHVKWMTPEQEKRLGALQKAADLSVEKLDLLDAVRCEVVVREQKARDVREIRAAEEGQRRSHAPE
jgi:hypothetical protein